MASTNALFTGLAGLDTNSRRLEVIGNNISNVNTTAYKSNRMLFSNAFNRTLSLGTGPTGTQGGTNPGQVGLGVKLAGTQRNFSNGAISTTGVNTDLAMEGNGFFVVQNGTERYFTRAGAFQLNSLNEYVTISGDRVMGYPVDDEFNVIPGQVEPVTIPIGQQTIAEATQNVLFSGNLNADGDLATAGTIYDLGAFTDATAGPGPATATSLLTDSGFTLGDTITFRNVEVGGRVVPEVTYTVGATSDFQELANFMIEAFGGTIAGGSGNPGSPRGGTLTMGAGGEMQVEFMWGTANEVDIDPGDIIYSGGPSPFSPVKNSESVGESVRTSFIAYDSLGTELRIELTAVLIQKDSNGTQWQINVNSDDDTDAFSFIEGGDRTTAGAGFPWTSPTISFDNFGQLTGAPQINIELDRFNTGALDPLQIALRFNSDSDNVTALSDTGNGSNIAAVFQDGSPIGVLSSFSFGEDGVITGGFTNGLTRTIGQLAVGTFTNPEGLVDVGNNLFAVGPNSGTALITEAGQFGTGRVIGGALELSNVDLSKEFTDMILTTTGYSAASRVITTTDELLQQLLSLVR